MDKDKYIDKAKKTMSDAMDKMDAMKEDGSDKEQRREQDQYRQDVDQTNAATSEPMASQMADDEDETMYHRDAMPEEDEGEARRSDAQGFHPSHA